MDIGMRDKLLQKLIEFFSEADDESQESDKGEIEPGHEQAESPEKEMIEQPKGKLPMVDIMSIEAKPKIKG